MGNLHPSRNCPKAWPILCKFAYSKIPREKGMEMEESKKTFTPSNVGQSLPDNPKITSNSVQALVIDNSEVY